MSKRWSEVDSYFAKPLIWADAALDEALAANSEAGLPSIDVSAPQGKLIHLPGAHVRRPQSPRDRDARRLFNDLAGACVA